MSFPRSLRLVASTVALASGLAIVGVDPASASPCIYQSLKNSAPNSIVSSFQSFSRQLNGGSLWQLGILASSVAAIGGGFAFDLHRQRLAAIAEAAKADADFEGANFAIAVPPEAIAPRVEVESESAIAR
jgi:hypothetical protein